VVIIGIPLSCTLLLRDPFNWGDLIPVSMLVAGATMVLGGFLPETRKALKELRDIAESTGPGWI
jgi:drug/metabolite transporter (DMT)-like permease